MLVTRISKNIPIMFENCANFRNFKIFANNKLLNLQNIKKNSKGNIYSEGFIIIIKF